MGLMIKFPWFIVKLGSVGAKLASGNYLYCNYVIAVQRIKRHAQCSAKCFGSDIPRYFPLTSVHAHVRFGQNRSVAPQLRDRVSDDLTAVAEQEQRHRWWRRVVVTCQARVLCIKTGFGENFAVKCSACLDLKKKRFKYCRTNHSKKLSTVVLHNKEVTKTHQLKTMNAMPIRS